MGRPLAYEYVGFTYKDQTYPVYRDDTDPDLVYVVPPAMKIAKEDNGKSKVNVAICETIEVPSVKGLGMMVPYLPGGLEDALKKEYNARVSPLPVASAGTVIALGVDWYLEGVAAEESWKIDETSLQGMAPDVVTELKKAKALWEARKIRTPLRKIVKDNGYYLQIPTLVGSNIGAEVPFSFGVFGKDNLKEFAALLAGGGVINGEVVYYYVGTTRPWALKVHADIGKVHSFLSQSFSMGGWYAKADIYAALEKMRLNGDIQVTVWDENDKVTEKYKPEKMVDLLLGKVVDKVFDFHADKKPDTTPAVANASNRWWNWSGAYTLRKSEIDIREIIDIKITIHGKSEPIPVSIGYYIDVPKTSVHSCQDINLMDAWQDEIIAAAYEASPEALRSLHQTLTKRI